MGYTELACAVNGSHTCLIAFFIEAEKKKGLQVLETSTTMAGLAPKMVLQVGSCPDLFSLQRTAAMKYDLDDGDSSESPGSSDSEFMLSLEEDTEEDVRYS